MKQLIPFLLAVTLSAQEITLTDALSSAESASAALMDITQKLTALDSTQNLYTTGANPELEVGTENFGVKEFEVTLSQEIRFPSKKVSAVQQIDLQRKQMQLSSEVVKRELYKEVVESYLTISQLQDEALLIDSIVASVKIENENISQRIAAGAASELELLEQQGLLIDLGEEAFSIQSELRASRAILNSLFLKQKRGSVETIHELSRQFNTPDMTEVPESHPALRELELERAEAQILRSESKAARTPDFTLSGGYKRENEAKENSLLFGFSLGLPFNKEAAIADSEADIAESSVILRKAELKRELQAELTQLQEEKVLASERLRTLREERIPLAEKMVQLATVQFKRGIIPVTEKIRYKRELISLQREEVSLLHAELLAHASLAVFTGTLQK